MTSKKTPQERFREFAAAMPALPTSLMATAHLPSSPAARRAARLMVGDLSSDEGRVARIATSLDRLVQLNQRQATSTGKQRRGSSK
ncbi:MAG: hypothetical protein KBG28_13120 [Kofleriaceae bacterium]|jgi:hypothetical protein|nr:hypothetical protein [Kofleriaceae bacterium]MBP9204905.1 hypothetical protein [Kofleriaceae bacterium]